MAPLEVIYDRFMRAEIKVPGADFCDMSATSGMKDMPLSEFQIVNAMLPRKYYPPLVGNIYERRSASVARQLFPGTAMDIDYDQLLDKRPNKPGAIFAWHQDMVRTRHGRRVLLPLLTNPSLSLVPTHPLVQAYWPPPAYTPDTRTATFSLAVDATNEKNGALKFIPGSHVVRGSARAGAPRRHRRSPPTHPTPLPQAKVIRPHVPVGATRDDAHAVAIKVDESKEPIVMAKLARGDVSVHNEYVVHGSAGNLSDGHRRTYVIAYRTAATIALERKAGFTHSHNDKTNWDTFNEWQKGAAPKA